MLSLKIHNVLDYCFGLVLIGVPWLFDFDQLAPARTVFVGVGLALLLYSAITNYHFARVRALPLGFHMTLDVCAGLTLILAPFILNYRDELSDSQSAAHMIFGLAAIVLVSLTRPRTERTKSPYDRGSIAHLGAEKERVLEIDNRNDNAIGEAVPARSRGAPPEVSL